MSTMSTLFKQYYTITVTGSCIMMYSMFFVHCYFVRRFLFIVILFNKSFKWHSDKGVFKGGGGSGGSNPPPEIFRFFFEK